jgi:hypothetical protein
MLPFVYAAGLLLFISVILMLRRVKRKQRYENNQNNKTKDVSAPPNSFEAVQSNLNNDRNSSSFTIAAIHPEGAIAAAAGQNENDCH